MEINFFEGEGEKLALILCYWIHLGSCGDLQKISNSVARC